MALTPAELAALQAAQIAQIAGPMVHGGLPPGVAANNPITGAVQPSVTEQGASQSSTSGGSSTKISARGEAALSEAEEANAAKVAAMRGSTLAPEPADGTNEAQSSYQAQQLQALGLKPVPAGQPQANMPYSSKQFNASPQMNAPRTFEAAQDEKAKYEADYNARVAAETQAKQAEIARNSAAEQQAAQARITAAAEAKTKAGHITTLWEDKSAVQKILSALALGLGSYGSAVTHSPNYAQELLKAQMDQDYQIKKAKLDAAVEEMRLAGAAPVQIREKQKFMEEQLMASQKAQLDTLQAKANQMLAPFPQAQQKAALAIATEQAAWKQKTAETIVSHTGQSSESRTTLEGPKTTTVTGQGEKGRTIPTSTEVIVGSQAKENARRGERLAALIASGDTPTSDQVSEIQDRQNKIMARQEEEKKSVGESVAGSALRAVDLVPSGVFPKGMTEKQKEAFTLEWQLGESESIKAAGTGWMANPEAYQGVIGRKVSMRGDSPELQKFKRMQLASSAIETGRLIDETSKLGKQEQQIGQVVTPEQKRVFSPSSAQPQKAPPPKSGAELAKALHSLPKDERFWASKALTMKKSDPGYAKAQSWLADKGLQ